MHRPRPAPNLSSDRSIQRREIREQRCLARTRAATDEDDLALANVEREIFKNHMTPVAHRDAAQANRRLKSFW